MLQRNSTKGSGVQLNITLDNIIQSTGCSNKVAEVWLPYFNSILNNFEINTPKRIAAFLSQIGHESGHLEFLEENLNYSADGLANTWPNRYAKKALNGLYAKNSVGRYLPSDLALKIARKPVLIASDCYANRMGNGSAESKEGWKFRGRGLIQVTGKSNYAQLTLKTGVDFISNPDLLKEPAYALISACWFWKSNNLNRFADKQDIIGLTKAINGGDKGLLHRKELYKKALEALTK